MSRLQTPRIAGVSGGVGTTTLATALRAHDRGRQADRGIEVLSCRCTGESLHRAATVVARLASQGKPRPVLAVTVDLPGALRGPLRARLRMIEPQVADLVLLPYVARWRELTDPLYEVAQLLGCPADDLPRALRGYAAALRELAQAIVRSGQLQPIAPARMAPSRDSQNRDFQNRDSQNAPAQPPATPTSFRQPAEHSGRIPVAASNGGRP